MNATSQLVNTSPCFQLKGGLFTLTAIHLLQPDLESFALQLQHKIQEAPNFFKQAPVVLDLSRLEPAHAELNFTEWLRIMRHHHLIPVGIRGGTPQHQLHATAAGLAILPETKSEGKALDTKENTAQPVVTPTSTIGKLVTQPVRSGQQIYARGGDLVVCAPVSPGAELLADGHIHVYGPLRGRALSGVLGNVNAYIFCQSLEAELISVAGQYRISENLKETCWKQPAKIYLQEGHLQIQTL